MPELTFKGSLPPSGWFRQAVAEAVAAANPVDDLLILAELLHEYERKNGMSSASFYSRLRLARSMMSCNIARSGQPPTISF